MFSLQRLFGKEDRFLDLLEASAKEAQKSAVALIKFLENVHAARTLDDFIVSRRAQKRIADQIAVELSVSFVTSIEREDIQALAYRLYKIPKTVEKIAERIMISPHWVDGSAIAPQAISLGKATDTLLLMVQALRGKTQLAKIKNHNQQLQTIEGEADKMLNELLRDLYTKPHDPLKVIFLKEAYELLERAVDRCRDAGNVINQIVLKSS
jgi:uncharacterized protein Yka (UPF0111/DUF47 family)